MRPWETPVPIPNTMVKPWTADGTWLVTTWESRWLPIYKKKNMNYIHSPCFKIDILAGAHSSAG